MKFRELLTGSRFVLAHRRKHPGSEQPDRRCVMFKLRQPYAVLENGHRRTYNSLNLATGLLARIRSDATVLEVTI